MFKIKEAAMGSVARRGNNDQRSVSIKYYPGRVPKAQEQTASKNSYREITNNNRACLKGVIN